MGSTPFSSKPTLIVKIISKKLSPFCCIRIICLFVRWHDGSGAEMECGCTFPLFLVK